MKNRNTSLAVHYHDPITLRENNFYFSIEFGRWIDSLSIYFKEIIIFAFIEDSQNKQYQLKSKNIRCKIIGYKKHPIKTLLCLNYYKKIIQKNSNQFDIICFRVPSLLAVYLSMFTKEKKQIFIIVGNMLNIPNTNTLNLKLFIYRMYWKFDYFLLSRQTKNRLIMSNNTLSKKIYKHIKNQNFFFTSTIWEKDIISRKQNFSDNEIKILSLGRFSSEKGLDILLKSVIQLNDKINISLKIVGNGDTNYTNYLKSIIKGKKCKIHFVDFVSDRNQIYKLMDESDVFILPSTQDAQPRTIWEAMSRGTPIICSDAADSIYNEFKNNKEILFFKSGSITDLCKKIESINKIEVRKKMSKESVKIAKRKTLEISAKQLVEFIK